MMTLSSYSDVLKATIYHLTIEQQNANGISGPCF